jgi:histidinol-phosphate aminotransferase
MSATLARRAIQELKAYESARSLTTEGSVFLDANEAPSSPLDDFSNLNRYPEPQPKVLVQKLSELYHVPVSQLMVGRGSDEAIDLLLRVFCESGKDKILICPPTYGMYEISAKIQGVETLKIPMIFKENLESKRTLPVLDEERILNAINSGVKIVFICSPNNPTATPFAPELLIRICQAAVDKSIVVVDEAYAEFSEVKSMTSMIDTFPNLVVLRTLSKAWAIAGARCGVALAQTPIIQLLHKVRAPYPMSSPAVNTILKSIDPTRQALLHERVKTIQLEREVLISELQRLSSIKSIFPSATNFLLVRTTDAKAVMTMARAQGMILRDRSSEYGLENCVRITLGTNEENQKVIALFKAFDLSHRMSP